MKAEMSDAGRWRLTASGLNNIDTGPAFA